MSSYSRPYFCSNEATKTINIVNVLLLISCFQDQAELFMVSSGIRHPPLFSKYPVKTLQVPEASHPSYFTLWERQDAKRQRG